MSEWVTTPLRQLADIRVSNVDKKASPSEQPVRLCNYMDVYGNDYIRADIPFMVATANTAEMARFKVDQGDVMITKDSETPSDIGIPSVVMDQVDDLVCGYHLALLKPNRRIVDPVFLAKQLGTDETARYFGRYAAGSTRYGLSNGAIANTQIRLAPLLQQQKIAAILTSIDTAIEKTEALIEKYQQIKAGLMHDLFTRGVLPNGQLRPPREQAPELYKETAIGWVPKEWRILPTGAISRSIVPGRDKPVLDGGGIPWITVSDLVGLFVTQSKEDISVSKQSLLVAGGRLIPKGAVILSCVGEFGLASIAGVELTMNQQLHAFQTNSDVLPEWLAYNIRRQKQYMERIATQTTIKYLNKAGCESIPVSLPGMSEQRQLCGVASRADQAIHSLEINSQKLKNQKLGLMQDLLTGKVPVRVDATEQEAA